MPLKVKLAFTFVGLLILSIVAAIVITLANAGWAGLWMTLITTAITALVLLFLWAIDTVNDWRSSRE